MTFEEFKNKFNISLTDEQMEAVKSIDQPTLLLAVPGSGKTTVLVTRLGYMIYCCNIKPEKILTLTYTVAATKDMKKRFISMFGQELADRLEFRTINGICAKIIANWSRRVGKKPFSLMDDERMKNKILSAIYREETGEFAAESDIKTITTLITYSKNMLLNQEEVERLDEENDIPFSKIYVRYREYLSSHSLMDYDDQMIFALMILKRNEEILDYYQDIYQYICVDEAQDTSKIQHVIIAMLASKYEKLFMVGDEDQSIYGFRAAYPEALLNFEKQHKNARVLLMSKNFRSDAAIVEAANSFIQKNELRHKKTMVANRENKNRINNIEVNKREDQYKILLNMAKNIDRSEGTTAILYRDNESILPVIDLYERNNIDYRIKAADITFFTNKVVMDIRNIINFANNPKDTDIFMKIYYKLGMYLSREHAMEACHYSEVKDMEVIDAALRYVDIKNGTRTSLAAIKNNLACLKNDTAARALSRIRINMEFQAYLDRNNIDDSKIQILRAIATHEDSAVSLLKRLDELSDIIKNKKSNYNSKLMLSTIHSSKGLEYDNVYIIDVKDGIFPDKVIHNREKATEEEIKLYEEERRLFYVAVTRARDNLYVFNFDRNSSFIRELLRSAIVSAEPIKKSERKVIITDGYYGKLHQKEAVPVKTKKTFEVAGGTYEKQLKKIKEKGYLIHKLLGRGEVLDIDGDSIQVKFKTKTSKCKLSFLIEKRMLGEWV